MQQASARRHSFRAHFTARLPAGRQAKKSTRRLALCLLQRFLGSVRQRFRISSMRCGSILKNTVRRADRLAVFCCCAKRIAWRRRYLAHRFCDGRGRDPLWCIYRLKILMMITPSPYFAKGSVGGQFQKQITRFCVIVSRSIAPFVSWS